MNTVGVLKMLIFNFRLRVYYNHLINSFNLRHEFDENKLKDDESFFSSLEIQTLIE